MQAIIMAAGKGSRLGELTGGNPKSFLEIHGKKLIEYNLEILKKIGVNEIIIVTGHKSEAFEELVKDIPNVTLAFNPFYEMMNVIGSFYFGMEYLHDDFLYIHADTLCDPQVFKKMISCSADIVLPVEFKACDDEAMKVKTENGKVVQITKQMPVENAEGEFIGIAFFRKNVISSLKKKVVEVLKEKRFTEYFESAIQKLIDDRQYNIQTVSMDKLFWSEIDFKEDYERATRNIPKYMVNGEYEL